MKFDELREQKIKLEQSLADTKKMQENEVNLWLKFETKLNRLWAIHWALEYKQKRSDAELQKMWDNQDRQKEYSETMTQDYTKYKAMYDECYTKLQYHEEISTRLEQESTIWEK